MTGSKSEAEIILELAKEKGALMFGEFRLSAGGTSSYYFDGRIVTLDPRGAYLVAKAFLPILKECSAEAIAGPTLGADPIVAAVAVLSYQEDHPIPGLIVRKEAKGHGGKRAIEGPLEDVLSGKRGTLQNKDVLSGKGSIPMQSGQNAEGARVAVVDDACSTGASLFHAIDAVEAAGCKVVKVLSILDRHQGGSDELRRRGYDFTALLEADEKGDIVPVKRL
jgi:orotate phosphoribosyltransferase